MKILLIGAGAGYSTKDLEIGYYDAFGDLGVDLSFYLLDRRLYVAKEWLNYSWKKMFNSDPERKPGWPDVLYRGSVEALEMALRFDVDWVFIISGMYLHSDVLIMMRRAGLKTALLLTESPYLDDQQATVAALVDVCFTTERTSVDYLKDANPNVHYIKHAYCPKFHFPQPGGNGKETVTVLSEWQQRKPSKATAREVTVRNHDVVFVGTGFKERIEMISAIDWSGIDLGLYGNWALLPSRHPLRKYLRSGIMTNTDAHELYRRAKVGLNLYRTSKEYEWNPQHIEYAESMNPRAYELAASMTFSVTDWRLEASEILGDTQPFIYDPSTLGAWIKEIVKNDSAREKFAKEAFERVQGHTFQERAKEVLGILNG